MRDPTPALVLTLAMLVTACGWPAPTSTAAGQTGSADPAVASGAATARPGVVPTPDAPEGVTEPATVVRVVDGDTIIVDRGGGNERLRYIGIDAPESVKPDSPVEFMGKEAAAANARLVEGRTVLLEQDVSDTDRFGRLLRYVWVEDPGRSGGPVLVNLELVGSGYAQAVTYPPDVRHADDFLAAERVAREHALGLWGEATPAP